VDCPDVKELLVDEIILFPTSITIGVEDIAQLDIKAYNYLGAEIQNFETIWSSSNSDIVSVVNGLITGVDLGVATITAYVCELEVQCEVEVINTYELTWNFVADWVLEEPVPYCSEYELSGDGFWEGSAVIEEHLLNTDTYYEIASISCDGLIQGISTSSCHGWIELTNNYISEMSELRSQILNSFDLYTQDSVKYMVDPFKINGSANPLEFTGLHEGSFYFYDEYSYGEGDYSFEDAWGALITPTTVYYTNTGYPFQIPQNYVIVFSNDDNDIPSDDPEGNSYTKVIRQLYAGVFDNIPGHNIATPSGLELPVYCDVEITLTKINTK